MKIGRLFALALAGFLTGSGMNIPSHAEDELLLRFSAFVGECNPKTQIARSLLVPERVDWIEVRRLGRRQDAEQYADEAGESECEGDGPQRDAGGRKGIDAA